MKTFNLTKAVRLSKFQFMWWELRPSPVGFFVLNVHKTAHTVHLRSLRRDTLRVRRWLDLQTVRGRKNEATHVRDRGFGAITAGPTTGIAAATTTTTIIQYTRLAYLGSTSSTV